MQPENIVLKDKGAKQLKIIDFGTAQDLTTNPNIKAMVGTPEFICEYEDDQYIALSKSATNY